MPKIKYAQCKDYESDKTSIEQANLTSDEYEKRVKEMCKKNGY